MKYSVGFVGWQNITVPSNKKEKEGKDIIENLCQATFKSKDYLWYYSHFFNFVQIDFLDIFKDKKILSDLPRFRQTLREWAEFDPTDFKFAIMVPKAYIDIYNDNHDKLERFLQELEPIQEKILVIVLKVPSTFTLAKDREWLNTLLKFFKQFKYSIAIEFEHQSWYQDLTYNILKKYNTSLIWSDRHKYHVITSNFLYLQITENLEKWIQKLKEKEKDIEKANNRSTNPYSDTDTIYFAGIVLDSNNISKINFIRKLFNLGQVQSVNNYNNPKNGIKAWKGKAIFHVDINSFYSSCEEIRDPSLKGKPHAVIMTDEENNNITKGVVATCSYEAKRLGVQSAMPLYKALKLCPNLILRAVDKRYYNMISEKVMEILERYADTLEQASIDEAYLDCTKKISSLNVTVDWYSKQIKKKIQDECHGLLTSIGVATTKSAAKIASDYQKPDGLTIVHFDELKNFLNPLEVERISGIGSKTQKILKEELKIKTIGELARANVQVLIEKFGKKTGTWMWQVANGEDDDKVTPRGDHVSLSNESTLDNFTQDRQEIQEVLYDLIDELYGRISSYGYQYRTVAIKIVRTDFSIESRETSYINYKNDRKSIASAIDKLLDRFNLTKNQDNSESELAKKIPPIRKVGVRVSNLIRIPSKMKINSQRTLLDYI
ncbi:MAG: DNA polymerase IV [Nitrososphaerota archaeon]